MASSAWLFYALVAALTLHQVSCFVIIEVFSDSACSTSAKLAELRLSYGQCFAGTEGCQPSGAYYNKFTCPTVPDYSVSPLYHSISQYIQNSTCEGEDPVQVFAVDPSAVGICLSVQALNVKMMFTETCSTDGQLQFVSYSGNSFCDPEKILSKFEAADSRCVQDAALEASNFGQCSSTTPVGNAPISSPTPPTSGARVWKVYSDSACQNQIAEAQQSQVTGCSGVGCVLLNGRYVKIECPPSVNFTFPSDYTSVIVSSDCSFTETTYAFAQRPEVTNCTVFPQLGVVAFSDDCADTLQLSIDPSATSCENPALDSVSSTTCGPIYSVLNGYHTCALRPPVNQPIGEPISEPISDTPIGGTPEAATPSMTPDMTPVNGSPATPDMTPVNGSPAVSTPTARGPRSNVSGASGLTGTVTAVLYAVAVLFV